MKTKSLIVLLIFFLSFSFAQESSQTFLSVSKTGVDEFHNLYPEYDGRGTIILVLDTGVDMGIDGLTKTSTGEVKVIDVQDFTKQGDIQLYKAAIREEDGTKVFMNKDMNYKVAGADKLLYQAVDNEYYIGAFKEESLINSNSGAADLNGDGKEDNQYMIVTFKTVDGSDEVWVAYVDTDGDGNISDEIALKDYRIEQQSFSIKNHSGLPLLTIGLNIFPDENRISFHFDDGSHGTHVAGIAAGHNIGGTGLTGVAPGAKVISLKLGNNNYSGGATVTESMKKAYLYADKISKEREEPCIINMSYGIGSEIEGRSEIENFLAQLLKENPYLSVCVGSGNEGPGISTIGLPSTSSYLFSSGAVLAQEVGRDLYSTNLKNDIILFFSSRGGEVTKPDVCSPGAATSTVPNWESRDRFWGTSMAAPYSAGVFSLLLSAMTKEYPDVKIPSQLLYKAVRESAAKMEGYTHLDQGAGYINVMEAYKLLKKFIDDGEIKNLETYTISSTAPNMPDGKAPNLYIRNGSFIKNTDSFNYTVLRNNFQQRDKFYRAYNIVCEEDWLIPVQKKTYLRNDQPTTITVKFDTEKMQGPGLYSGKIKAYRDDFTKFPEFEMLATVVIPYEFTPDKNYELKWTDKQIEAGMVDRYFINLPPGQTSMRVELTRNPIDYSMTRYLLFNPDGINIGGSALLSSANNRESVERYFYNLAPGIYEIVVDGLFRADETSNYNLSIKFSGISTKNQELSVGINHIQVINLFNNPVNYNLSGKVMGYEIIHDAELKGDDNILMPFTFNAGEDSKEFKIKLRKEDYNKLTDFSMLILNEEGRIVRNDALSYAEGSLSIQNHSGSEDTKYTLQLIPGFTHLSGEMKFEIIESTTFSNPDPINVKYAGRNNVALYPNIPVELECGIKGLTLEVPEEAKVYGTLFFESSITKIIEHELPVYIINNKKDD
jgi:tripeptidyl-peptidase II